MGRVLSFPGRNARQSRKSVQPLRGEILILPSEEMGGSWAVVHYSQGGNSAAHVGTWFAYDDALAAARKAAAEYRARFDDGSAA